MLTSTNQQLPESDFTTRLVSVCRNEVMQSPQRAAASLQAEGDESSRRDAQEVATSRPQSFMALNSRADNNYTHVLINTDDGSQLINQAFSAI